MMMMDELHRLKKKDWMLDGDWMVDVGYMVNQPPHRYQLFNFTQMKCLL
jgi:hypothetical protein